MPNSPTANTAPARTVPDSAEAIARTIDPSAGWGVQLDYDYSDLREAQQEYENRQRTALAKAQTIRNIVIDECAQVAKDHTPRKHEGTLAAHVTGSRITDAIRSLKSGRV